MLTDDEILDLVRECDIDWHAGWAGDDEDNRYARLARAIERAAIDALRRELVAGDGEGSTDTQRLNFIAQHARSDPKMDGQHVWWPTTFKHALRGPTLRAEIDNAMGDAVEEKQP